MIDHECGEEPKDHSSCALRGQRKRYLVSILAGLLGLCLLAFASSSRRPYTCSICRKEKVDHECLGLRWSDQVETDCSLWYRSNFEPSHSHTWVQCTYCRRFGIPGLFGGYACVIGGPITGLSRTVQMEIYRHFEDRLEAKKLFIRLGEIDGESARMWKALMEWVEEDYPGTWHDWWEKHRVEDLDRVQMQPR
jgi:hypothetical protein